MAMFNMEAIAQQRALMEQKQYSNFGQGGGGNRSFGRIGTGALKPGNYRIRFLPPMLGKNPAGAYFVSTHKIEHDASQATDDTIVLSAECIPSEAEQCWLITQMLDLIDKYGVYEKLDSKALKRVIDKLKPWRRWWFPILLLAREVPAAKEGERSHYEPIPSGTPGAQWLDRVLEVNANIKLPGKIFELWDAYQKAGRHLAHPELGNDCILVVEKNKHEIKVIDPPCAIDPAMQKFIADEYPDLPDRARHWNFKEPPEIISMCQNAWWAPYFEQIGIQLSKYQQKAMPRIVPAADGSEG